MEEDEEFTASETTSLISIRKRRDVLLPYLAAQLQRTDADFVLLGNYFITGLLDSAATMAWEPFVSMQTGNSIYLGLGLIDPGHSTRWIKSAVSIACFCLGSFCFARLHRAYGSSRQRTRLTVALSYFLQFLLIMSAAVIVRLNPTPNAEDGSNLYWFVLLPVGLVAAQSAGQTASSRALEHKTLTSTVLTTVYCDLFADENIFAALTSNRTRNQRLLAPILLILGAMSGGFWAKSSFGIEGALWTAMALKGVSLASWLLWPQEQADESS